MCQPLLLIMGPTQRSGSWNHNKNTRITYHYAASEFLDWCSRAGFRSVEDIKPITIAAYIECHPGSPPTIKQHMAAIQMFLGYSTEKGILAMTPAREVKSIQMAIRSTSPSEISQSGESPTSCKLRMGLGMW